MSAFHGQMGMFVRALAYILSHGGDGLRQASEDAVLAANYVRASLVDLMSAPFGDRPCMHEALFDDRWLKDTGLTTLDFAKAMIDEGYHPMTVYFPLVVHGAMLIEPTESESKASLDLFIMTLRDLAMSALAGERERFVAAPVAAPRRRLDETRAARQPTLRWAKAGAGLRARRRAAWRRARLPAYWRDATSNRRKGLSDGPQLDASARGVGRLRVGRVRRHG